MFKSIFTPFVAVALLVPTAAIAREHVDAAKSDPNRVVCRTVGSTGSRLSQTKQCMTNAQWAENKLADRQAVERIQANRYKNN